MKGRKDYANKSKKKKRKEKQQDYHQTLKCGLNYSIVVLEI